MKQQIPIIKSKMNYDSSELIQNARLRYFKANGISLDGGLHDKWARYKIAGFSLIGFPNFKHRLQAIFRHDLHHIVLNLDTSSKGEGLIAAWELGSGCGLYWISWCMEPQALWWGLLMAPLKTIEFFTLGRNSQNFFHKNLPELVLEKSVGELRELLLPENMQIVQTRFSDIFFLLASAILGVFMILIFIPIFIFFTVFGGLFELISKPRSK